MLKFKKKELLTKIDKSFGKSEHGCCWGGFLFEGEGGLVVCRWRELGLGRRRRNREERVGGVDIY
jgi:hypothetical protein